jgi:DnaJ-class molecular chaperone
MPTPTPKPADHWRRLGLEPGAGPDQIKAAFRRLAKEIHPDGLGLRADPEGFTALYQSYRVLMDVPPAEAALPSFPRTRGRPGPDWRLIDIQRQGLDLIYRVELSGRPRRLSLPLKRWVDCPDCWPGARADCQRCHGLGRVRRFGMIHLDLPEGARRLRLAGLGDLGPRGPGDLIVVLVDGTSRGVEGDD